MRARAQFLRFCLVGCIGFAVDAGTTLWLTQRMGRSAEVARLAAFALAATVTWALNRRFTFNAQRTGGTWLKYLLTTAGGAVISVGVYSTWLRMAGRTPLQLLGGVGLGAVCALAFNFGASRYLVFRPVPRSSGIPPDAQ